MNRRRAQAEECCVIGVSFTAQGGTTGCRATTGPRRRGPAASVVPRHVRAERTPATGQPTKTDLAARPVFHRLRDSIEAHLTIVFAALAVSREAQARTGLSINKIVKTLRPLRTATITLGRQQITAEPRIPAAAQQLLDDLAQGGH
jgi:hypothetical protein